MAPLPPPTRLLSLLNLWWLLLPKSSSLLWWWYSGLKLYQCFWSSALRCWRATEPFLTPELPRKITTSLVCARGHGEEALTSAAAVAAVAAANLTPHAAGGCAS